MCVWYFLIDKECIPFKHWTSDRRADHVYIGSVGPWPNLDICSTSKLGPLFGPSNCDLTWTSYWRSTFDQHLVIVLDVIWTSMKGAGNLHYNYLQISTLLLSTWLIYDYRLFLNRHDWLCVCLFIYVGHVFWFCVIFMTAHREFAKESTWTTLRPWEAKSALMEWRLNYLATISNGMKTRHWASPH